jgi:hypothetical protein
MCPFLYSTLPMARTRRASRAAKPKGCSSLFENLKNKTEQGMFNYLRGKEKKMKKKMIAKITLGR